MTGNQKEKKNLIESEINSAYKSAFPFGIAKKKKQKRKLSYYFPLAAINRAPNLGT